MTDRTDKLLLAAAAAKDLCMEITVQIVDNPSAPDKKQLEGAIAGVIHTLKCFGLDWGAVTDAVTSLDVQAGRQAADKALEALSNPQKAPIKPADAPSRVTLSGKPASLPPESGAPQPINPATGQHADYWVLSPAERAKGFVRPVRDAYKHVGAPAGKYPLRDLTESEKETYKEFGYVKFEAYPESESPLTGKYWTQKMLDAVGVGCGRVTTMNSAIAETYARDPKFYGSTFCVDCCGHYPVNEFVWAGTDERVGT